MASNRSENEPHVKGSNSSALLVVGAVLLVLAVAVPLMNPGGEGWQPTLFAIAGVGLLVAGLVARLRS